MDIRLPSFLMMLSVHILYEPAIWLLGIYWREVKVYVSTKLYMHVIEAIFEISKTLIRNINCSEIDERIKNHGISIQKDTTQQ